LYHTWGDLPYPEERIYSEFGELVQLHTYRGGSGWNGATWPASPGSDDVANWWYDGPSGVLLGKTDANGKGITNVYYANNALYFRLWARGVRATNLYSASGDLYRVAYSDSLTPTVTYTNWNRAGQPRTIFDASGQHTLTYDYASRLVSDYCPSGLVAGVTVSNHFNAKYGRDYLEVQSGAFTLHHDFGYDGYGRLNMVSNGTQAAIYSYLPGTDRLQSTAFHSSGSPVMTTTRAWQFGERLQSIANVANAAAVSSHCYLYDAIHRRTQANMEDGSVWKYDYDDRNELTAGRRYWADWSAVGGQRFE